MVRKVQPSDLVIGSNLRMLRHRRGISQTQLAEQLGVTFQQVQKYEKGFNRISASTLLKIANTLGCNLMEFFSEPGQTGSAPSAAPPAQQAGRLDRMVTHRVTELKNSKVKRQLLNLLDALVEAERAAGPHGERGEPATYRN